MDTRGNVIIHPELTEVNVFEDKRFPDRTVKIESTDEVGELTFYYNSFMDRLTNHDKKLLTEIQDRCQAQEALKESEEKYRFVMEAVPDSIVVYDMKGCVSYMNPAFTKVFGYTLENNMGKTIDHFVPKAHWKETMEGIGTILKGKILPRVKTKRMAKNGRLIDVTIQGSVYLYKNGNPLGSVITHRDVSEVKRLEKAIMEISEKERQTIGNDFPDDLCPHLIGIEGLTKVLKKKAEGQSPAAVRLLDQITELIKEAISKTSRLAGGFARSIIIMDWSLSLRTWPPIPGFSTRWTAS